MQSFNLLPCSAIKIFFSCFLTWLSSYEFSQDQLFLYAFPFHIPNQGFKQIKALLLVSWPLMIFDNLLWLRRQNDLIFHIHKIYGKFSGNSILSSRPVHTRNLKPVILFNDKRLSDVSIHYIPFVNAVSPFFFGLVFRIFRLQELYVYVHFVCPNFPKIIHF